MKKQLNYFYFFCLMLLFLLPQKVLGADYSMEKIFYLANYNAASGVASVNQNWQKIDILAPQYFSIGANLKISGGFGPKLKAAIAAHNLKVMPLLVNAGFSQKIIHNLLASPTHQDRIINALVIIAKNQKYIGWQFDFENINYQDKDLFTAFVQKAYPVFQKNNLVFSVAVVPRTCDYEDTNAFKNWGGVYDYQKIAQSTDFVSLMAYDDSNSVGPAASVDFVNKVLSYVKGKIPAEKLSLGVPLYYWKWNADANKKIGSGLFKNILAVTTNFRHVLSFDSSLGVSCISYFYNNKNYKIWFENAQSFQAKLGIVKSNNFRGFSAWLIGGEDPGIWKIL